MEDRRFIEESFPVKEISEESAKEKSIRHGHLSTLHIWWARRPLASSRAVSYAALIHALNDADKLAKKKQFIVNLAKWENSLDYGILGIARKEIVVDNGGRPPRVLDPFAGGGAIPLEAMRLGCETYASDYNPVATLILKCSLEYPQVYGPASNQTEHGLLTKTTNRLLEDVRKWGAWVQKRVEKEIGELYPEDKDRFIPVGYVWARTIQCQNPSCEAQIPLMRQFWLSKKGTTGVSLYPYVHSGEVRFRIVGVGREPIPKGFNPNSGTVDRAVATCLVCKSMVDNKTTPQLFRKGKASQKLVAIILRKKGVEGKKYRVAVEDDQLIFKKAERLLSQKEKLLSDKWGVSAVPDELTPEGKGRGAERAFSLRNYGMNTWGDLYNSRQKLALITFVEAVREAHEEMVNLGYDPDYAKAVTAYLALGVDRLADFDSTLCVLNPTGGRGVVHTFGRQVLQMVWDYTESNPFNPSGAGWPTAREKNEKWIEHASAVNNPLRAVLQSSATSLPYDSGFFDAVFTDPPYYDNVPYSYLSDFFYVWLKRGVGRLYPDLFATPLTPKGEEIVAYSNIKGGFEAGKQFFEEGLRKSFREIHRILRPNGIAVIVYAHKSTAGWETLINSLLDSGLVVTGAWPLHTEKKGRLRSQESAALASSIYVIARKLDRKPIGFYSEVKQELKAFLNKKLDQIWREGISGADFFISAIGSAIEVFGNYEKVIDDEGNTIRGDRLLEDVRRIVIDYAVKQVLHNGFAAEIKPMTRFYVLWRWAYGDALVDFDDARKLGQSVGIDVSLEWNRGFISKEKEFIEVLGPEDRQLDNLESSSELVDVLHRVLLLWKNGRYDDVTKVLRETGYGKSDVFYRVAQAISESLTNGNHEKKLLDGFLSGKERVVKEVKKEAGQTRLVE